MHKYLSAIGFSCIHNKKDYNKLLKLCTAGATERSYTSNGDDTMLTVLSKEFAPGMGLSVCGEYDENNTKCTNYDKLMKFRLEILKKNGLGLKEIQETIKKIDPLPGAKEFMDELRKTCQTIILSDTFEQFAAPLMEKLGMPTIFCNTLEVAENGEITGYRMRWEKSKLTTVKALQSIGYETIASGDSFNDLGMIQASKAGFLFRSTEQIIKDYPQYPAFTEYKDLLNAIKDAIKK